MSRFGTGSCRNANYSDIDNARSNSLIWQPENPPVGSSACLPADLNAGNLRFFETSGDLDPYLVYEKSK
ncbi:MAG: hypothetical protein DMF20_04160 [Verrucomicrobia bacterium]|nr:MAG: hypothetical protein DMF20_04160 [Verrucomicrobiota bacterium]